MRYNKIEAKFKSHYILKRVFRQFAINDNDISAGKMSLWSSFREFKTWKSLVKVNLEWDNQLQKLTWDTVPYFGINSLSTILCFWSPLHPLSKLLAIEDHTQTVLEEQLWMEGRKKVSIISHRPLTRSDLQQGRSFFRGSVSTFLQLVVASEIFASVRLFWRVLVKFSMDS